MPNSCYFQMKIAGPEMAVQEMVSLLDKTSKVTNIMLGKVDSFNIPNPGETEMDPLTGWIAVFGEGDCANSVLTSMRERPGGMRSLESETARLGLAVEYYSSDPHNEFQEHGKVVCGQVVEEQTVHYEEFFVEDKSEDEIAVFCEEHGISRVELDAGVNCNGEYCIGGFEDFGVFGDLFGDLVVAVENRLGAKPIGMLIGDAEKELAENSSEDIVIDILQVKSGAEGRDFRFASLGELENGVDSVSFKNYNHVYRYSDEDAVDLSHEDAVLDLLENVYTRFNFRHPEDFRGHSLSMSDVVVLTMGDVKKAYYCDSIGFAKLPDKFAEEFKCSCERDLGQER